MITVDLNCDMGEGIGDDAAIMPYITSANISCGYHAGDEKTIRKTIEAAIINRVAIGAHPGFADRANFGRIEMDLDENELQRLITSQLEFLSGLATACGTQLHHVKPHGALYNMAATNATIATSVCKAVKSFDTGLIIYGLAGSELPKQAEKIGLKGAHEVFADRRYQENGQLVSRKNPNAIIMDPHTAAQQVMSMIQTKTVMADGCAIVPIIAETVCIHGDHPRAKDIAIAIRQSLKDHDILVEPITG